MRKVNRLMAIGIIALSVGGMAVSVGVYAAKGVDVSKARSRNHLTKALSLSASERKRLPRYGQNFYG